MRAPSDSAARPWVLIEDSAGLDAAGHTAQSYGLVAGNAHIAAELTRRGITHLSGGDLQDHDDAIAATAAADDDLAAIAQQLDRLPDALRAITMATLARESLRHHALRRVAAKLDAPFLQHGLLGLETASGQLRGFRGGLAPKCPAPRTTPRRADYVMDFSSATGRKQQAGKRARLQPRQSTRPAWQDTVLNRLAVLAVKTRPTTPQALRVRLAQADPVALPEISLTSDFEACARQLVTETTCLFAAAEEAMDRTLCKYGTPEKAVFNHVGDAVVAGFQASLRNAGVPCEMSSHGALAAWGDGARHRMAARLGPIYNAFPGMTRLYPRAPALVEPDTAANVATQSRLRAARSRRDGGFRVYAAPNFRPWSEGFWGITNTCFDTLKALQLLARAVRSRPGTEMFLRIKLTAKDIATPAKRPANRGLFPEDAAHLIDPEAGIHDASHGAHSAYLADADLVTTEGLTAVMFEALEARCPVLLIVPDARAIPALPAASVSRLAEPGFRSAVYTACPSDDLTAALVALEERHMGRPLTDAELEPHIWATK